MNYTELSLHHIFFGTVETLGLFSGSVTNLLLLTYHLKQLNKSATTVLFGLMNATDLLICILMIPTAVSSWCGSKPTFFKSMAFREFWYFVWEVCGRTSVFLIGLQSVLRTRALLSPFSRPLKKFGLSVIMITYTVILCGIQSVRFFLKVNSVYQPEVARPILNYSEFIHKLGYTNGWSILFMIMLNLFGHVIPFLPITISCFISIYCIRRSRNLTTRRAEYSHGGVRRPRGGRHGNKHREATTTVIVLTVVYLLTNCPLFIKELNEMLVGLSYVAGMRLFFIDWFAFYQAGHVDIYVFIYVMIYNVCILLNSTFNGFVLMRGAAVQSFLLVFLRKIQGFFTIN